MVVAGPSQPMTRSATTLAVIPPTAIDESSRPYPTEPSPSRSWA